MSVRPEFASHKLNTEGLGKVSDVRASFTRLLEELELVCPASREFSIVKTKLEEASFFAVKAISANEENQEK